MTSGDCASERQQAERMSQGEVHYEHPERIQELPGELLRYTKKR